MLYTGSKLHYQKDSWAVRVFDFITAPSPFGFGFGWWGCHTAITLLKFRNAYD